MNIQEIRDEIASMQGMPSVPAIETLAHAVLGLCAEVEAISSNETVDLELEQPGEDTASAA